MGSLSALRRRIAEGVRKYPRLWTVLNPPYRAALDGINEVRLRAMCRGVMIHDAERGNDTVRAVVQLGRPAALGKVGSLEAEALACFLKGREYPDILRKQMLINVGIHPADRAHIDAFCEAYVQAADALTVIAARGHPGELEVINRVVGRTYVRLSSFDPWLFENPWSSALEGKRVLVVTPFARSVESQMRRRADIWRNPRLLPPCEVRAVRMPLSPGLVAPEHKDWRERYDALVEECERAPYDIMLAGAGGLSLPLVAHAKAQGRIGFHLGGTTQILFGITGRRWAHDHRLIALQTDAWIRPSGDEAPATVSQVEQGCYW